MLRAALYLQSALYILSGLNHFRKPDSYVFIVPHCVPLPSLMVQVSGVLEIVLGILLLTPSTRRFAAWGIILLLIAVLPANIQMALNYVAASHPFTWLAIVRLPFQLVLIWLAWLFARKRNSSRKTG